MKRLSLFFACLFSYLASYSNEILVYMDNTQKDHLKAYGIAYYVLKNQVNVDWLLNYRGGSFMFPYTTTFENELRIRNVSYQVISGTEANAIRAEIQKEDVNMDVMRLEVPPKVAVFTPKDKLPWDDAVTLALTYAEIPYDKIFIEEILTGKLKDYDWLHLHHEDFTGQYGKFWASQGGTPWYKEQVNTYETMAKKFGYTKVSKMELAVVLEIRKFVASGGFLFAMCSATDTYDIALCASETDICPSVFDHDNIDPQANQKLNFKNTFAFKDFNISYNAVEYEHSDIDATNTVNRYMNQTNDFFTLFEFSAKWDPVPSMLCQNHTLVIPGFMGQTTGFMKKYIKSEVLIMGEYKSLDIAKYIHGNYGKGTWTWYGGHDPEDYQHFVNDPPTDLALHKNSPGYRLILNNVLFPAAKKKKQKT